MPPFRSSHISLPHEVTPLAWCATAWPNHKDWGSALGPAQAELAALVAAMAGKTPPTALVRPPAAHDSPPPAQGLVAMATPNGLIAPTEVERMALGLVSGPPVDEMSATLFADVGPSPALPSRPLTTTTPSHSDHPQIVLFTSDDGHGASENASPDGPLGGEVKAIRAPYGDIWLRDTGPMFVHASDDWRAVAFRFNGWGGRYVYAGDEAVAEHIARLSQRGLHRLDMVGEPGALEYDGEGTVIASRRCLLNVNRNPAMSQTDAEAVFAASLGVERVIWIEECLAGDHTDGHADTLVRFVRPGLVVTEAPTGRSDPNASDRDAVARRLDGAKDAQGRAIDVVRVPGAAMPPSSEFGPLPATHTNYVIVADRVIIPLYADPSDRGGAEAAASAVLDAFGPLFPRHQIVGLPCRAMICGGGGFHCATTHAPASAGELVVDDAPRPGARSW